MTDEGWVVVDLGFGDAGKGAVTDRLVREREAGLVVRFHGGAQAGHNVVAPDGRHHTFSQFCAGTFAGAHGLLGPDFLLHPLAMWFEAEHLRSVGVTDPWALTEVARSARVITPYQQAAGQARERARGAAAHGTCGVGIGERVADGLLHPDDALFAGDLGDPPTLRRRLAMQRERKRTELARIGEIPPLFDDPEVFDRVLDGWRTVAGRLRRIDDDQVRARIRLTPRVVFEGAQGLLLDQDWGFHPHTTWSDCTPAGARALAGDRALTVVGVTRAYTVRHGPGPLPTEGRGPNGLIEPHNGDAGWQGRFRSGALDGVLLRYAARICGGIDRLAVTWTDRVPHGPVCDAYLGEAPADLAVGSHGRIRSLIEGERDDLGHRERLGAWLRTVDPEIHTADPARFASDTLGLPLLGGRAARTTALST